MKKEVEEEEKIVGDLNWDGLHRPRIYYAMATTFCGLFLSVLDGTICNVALPSIAQQLHVSSSDSIWIVNSFQLVIMMTLLPFSSMGERWGYKQVYLRGVVVFTIGSLLFALSPNLLVSYTHLTLPTIRLFSFAVVAVCSHVPRLHTTH